MKLIKLFPAKRSASSELNPPIETSIPNSNSPIEEKKSSEIPVGNFNPPKKNSQKKRGITNSQLPFEDFYLPSSRNDEQQIYRSGMFHAPIDFQQNDRFDIDEYPLSKFLF